MAILNNNPLVGASGNQGGYNINNSLRFRSSASAYLSRTPASAGNRQVWTWSCWVKKTPLASGVQAMIAAGVSTTVYDDFCFENDQIRFVFNNGTYDVKTTQVFRDPSAWYHVIVAMDTTQATASNRVKIYVNGSQVTAFATANYPAQNHNTNINNNILNNIGNLYNGSFSSYFDGYMAEVNFIDGQALTPSSFGSTNATTGVWQPAKYTGTYGTNGFYLPFKNNTTSTYAGTFNGSTQSLSVASNAVFGYGTSDFTMEGWFYFNNLNTMSVMSNLTTGSSVAPHIYYDSSSGLSYYTASAVRINGGALQANNWYHIAVSRSGTSTKMFVNGIQVGSTYTDTNNYGTSNPFIIADYAVPVSGSSEFNGNISNVRVVKGTALYTSNFVPSSVSLTAITNTSILTLQSATIVDNSGNSLTITNNGTVTTSTATPFVANIFGDNSGNNNNWRGNNINYSVSGTTYDAMTDVPTNTSATASNFATLNPLVKSFQGSGIANGNLSMISAAGNWEIALSTISASTGKYYCEVTISSGGNNNMFGVFNPTQPTWNSGTYNLTGGTVALFPGWQQVIINGSASGSFGAMNAGDNIGMALDLNASTITYYKNGSLIGGGAVSLPSNMIGIPLCFAVWSAETGSATHINFGQRPFSYTPPTGYLALNTFNLPNPTILQGNKYMDATLYTGNGSTQTITNAAGFKPDLVWVKARSVVRSHKLTDSVRGATKVLASNNSDAEDTNTTGLTAFNSNGFTLGADTNYNDNTVTFVGWQWQAGQGSTSSNTSGSITSTVSVNTTAGFSIVTYASSSGTNTVGHGLGVAPKMVIWKSRSNTTDWVSYHASLPASQYINLNSTAAAVTNNLVWNNTAPTSSVVTIGSDLSTYGNIVLYCFAEIAGFSRFGSYTGNGSTDGVFVYLGFRPKFIITKVYSTSGYNWNMYDSSRGTYNVADQVLVANGSGAEETGFDPIDFLSNGFKLRMGNRGSNVSGASYIYMAFAENPFKNSLAR